MTSEPTSEILSTATHYIPTLPTLRIAGCRIDKFNFDKLNVPLNNSSGDKSNMKKVLERERRVKEKREGNNKSSGDVRIIEVDGSPLGARM